jgi:hypothetical protein
MRFFSVVVYVYTFALSSFRCYLLYQWCRFSLFFIPFNPFQIVISFVKCWDMVDGAGTCSFVGIVASKNWLVYIQPEDGP